MNIITVLNNPNKKYIRKLFIGYGILHSIQINVVHALRYTPLHINLYYNMRLVPLNPLTYYQLYDPVLLSFLHCRIISCYLILKSTKELIKRIWNLIIVNIIPSFSRFLIIAIVESRFEQLKQFKNNF